jgi:glycine/D-amino acid oxidase-like deaminating enzyme
MDLNQAYDAVVVGSGPNGLSAAIALAQAGQSVLVIEKADTLGGGARSAELTLPGFLHDPCAAIMPLGVASPFIGSLPLEQYGFIHLGLWRTRWTMGALCASIKIWIAPLNSWGKMAPPTGRYWSQPWPTGSGFVTIC